MKSFLINTDETVLKKLNIITKTIIVLDSNKKYLLLNSDTDFVCDSDSVRSNYRGVTMDPILRKILSIGPFQMKSNYLFDKMTSDEKQEQTIIQKEFIDGMFFALFYDIRSGEWEISTNQSIGGNEIFHTQTLRETLLDILDIQNTSRFLNLNPIFSSLEYSFCYHFILQYHTKKLYCVGVYQLLTDNQLRFVSNEEYQKWDWSFSVTFPKILVTNNVWKPSTELIHPTNELGIVFLDNHNGISTTMVTSTYLNICRIRSVPPRVVYLFICLKRINKMNRFLKLFLCYKDSFKSLNIVYNQFVLDVYHSYMTYYIYKTTFVVPFRHKDIIMSLHKEIYIPSLREKKKVRINVSIVHQFVQSLDPGFLFHRLQYESFKE